VTAHRSINLAAKLAQFLVLEGEMEIAFRDGAVTVRAGEMFVIRRGREHKTRAVTECHALLIEPRYQQDGEVVMQSGSWAITARRAA
jgi:mannose-6-phosphate isomerase-like protein (cupin superfamily)